MAARVRLDRRRLVLSLVLAAALVGIWFALTTAETDPQRKLPAAVENVSPADGELVLRQTQVVVDLAPGYRGKLFIDGQEIPLVERIRSVMGAPSHSLAGRLSLGELGGLLSLAPALISNNTGPVHIAAAVGTPVVDLYALTNPQHAPWGVPSRVLSHDVPCKYCYKSICPGGHHNCRRLVTPEQVVQATLARLAETGRSRAMLEAAGS